MLHVKQLHIYLKYALLALCYVAGDYSSGMVTSDKFPEYWSPIRAKRLIRELQIPERKSSFLAGRLDSGASKIFFCEISIEDNQNYHLVVEYANVIRRMLPREHKW